ncbi:MAG: LPXTG cell wall anchor domain-containing protein [Eubacterium sp.]|nr:LPXTG cell wall anchor domain-containing protein [Eubacterium sp.]
MNTFKKLRRTAALMLALIVALSTMSLSAFAVAQGQGTLKISNAMKGQSYRAYKIFNAVYEDPADDSDDRAVVYTVPEELEDQVTTPFTVGTTKASNGEKIVTVAKDTSDADILAWAKANYSKFDTSGNQLTYNNTDGTAVASLDYGYYYVTSSLGTVVSIDSLDSEQVIVDKNESQPEAPSKVITTEKSAVFNGLNQTRKELKENDAAVGSVQTFSVTFQATNWVEDEESDAQAGTGTGTKTKVTSWNFTDTPEGMEIDPNSVLISVNEIAIYEGGVSDNQTYPTVVTGGGKDPLSISIPWVNANGASLYPANTAGSEHIPVVITYDATITSAAATAVAPNSIDVKYNNTTSIGSDTTSTYTYKFQLNKVQNEENGYAPLEGAKFQLYASDGTTLLKFDKGEGTSANTYTFNKNGSVDTIDMTSSTSVLIQGLDKADYVLKETQAPAGYNKAQDQTINAANLVRVDKNITDSNGIENDTGVISVINETGRELPSTGGIGTTIFYITGTLLVLGAGVVLVTRRRMAA